jgi:hypothetical protein
MAVVCSLPDPMDLVIHVYFPFFKVLTHITTSSRSRITADLFLTTTINGGDAEFGFIGDEGVL